MKQILLYHGTDKRMVLMSKEEREKYIGYCWRIIEYLSNLRIALTPAYKKEKPAMRV